MEIRAFLNDDGTASASFGDPGNMASIEVDWHTAELVLKAADGSLVRSVTRTLGGETVVGGPGPVPAADGAAVVNGTASAEIKVQHTPEPSAEKPAEVEAHADSVASAAGDGFKGMSQHADEAKG